MSASQSDLLEKILKAVFASQSAGITSLTVGTTSVKILSSNSLRRGAIVYNSINANLFLALGVAANNTTRCSFFMTNQSHLILPLPIYTGDIFAMRTAGSGIIAVTEIT